MAYMAKRKRKLLTEEEALALELERNPITDDEFYAALADLVHEMDAEEILGIPGVYEAVSEQLNNEAIDRALENRDVGHL